MKKKVALGCVLMLSAMTVVSRCGGNEKKATEEGGKAKIRFVSWGVADDIDRQQAIVDKFNEEHEDIEVTLEAYGSDFDTKISAGMGSGDTPDVMYMWNYPAYYEGLEHLVPPLTTVHIPMNFMGDQAVTMLAEKIYSNREINMCVSIPARLILRESVSNRENH